MLNTIKYFIAYLFVGLAIGAYFPILTLYLSNNLELSGPQIGTLMAVITILPIFVLPFWGIFTDKIKSPKVSLLISLSFSSILMFSLTYMKSFIPFLIVISIFMLFRTPIFSLYDEILVNIAKEKKMNYGTFRLANSFGFSISPFIGIFLSMQSDYGFKIVFILSSICFLIVTLMVLFSKDVHYKEKEQIKIKRDIPKLFKNRIYIYMCIIYAMTYGVLDSNLSYMSSYLHNINSSPYIPAIAVFLSVIIEVPTLFLTKYIYKRVSFKGIILFVTCISLFRYTILFLFPVYQVVLILAPLHGLTFGLSYPMLVQFIADKIDKKYLATGYTIYNSFVSMFTAGFSYITGFLYVDHVQNIFLFFFTLLLVNFILILLVLKKFNYKVNSI